MPTTLPVSPDDPVAATLLADYFAFRIAGFTTHSGGYTVAGPDPAAFEPPRGVFLVLRDDEGEAVGCGGVRRINELSGMTTFEVKHLWIAQAARGRGWSHLMLEELEAAARGFGAEQLVLDTNETLVAAQHLYAASGFEPTEPYNTNPNATHWFRKLLV